LQVNSATIVGAAITLAIAFLGFIATYINNLRLNQRQARLDRVNRQLSELYGPVLAIRGAANEAFNYFIAKYKFEDRHISDGRASEEELAAWRLWMKTVFMPSNRRIYELVLSKADLLLGNQMPQDLLTFFAHVLAYEVVLTRWDQGDFTEHASIIDFPEFLDGYIKHSYSILKQEQSRLLGSRSQKRLTSLPQSDDRP
jgi:hypothetical protein